MINAIAGLFTDKPDLPPTPASLFYRTNGYAVGALYVHLILSEDHALVSQVTSHPVEDGSVISDHIRNELRAGSLKALVTNHSIRYANNDKAADPEMLIKAGKNAVLENTAMSAWEVLKSIHAARELVTIATVLEVYDDVAITSIEVSRDSDSGEALEFAVNFQQVKKVQLRGTDVTAQVQPTDMKNDINRKSAVSLNGGQKVASGNYSMNAVLVKLRM
jgi:hypothetical protein